MAFPSLRNLFHRKSQTSRNPRRSRLLLEPLEDRMVLSNNNILWVNKGINDGFAGWGRNIVQAAIDHWREVIEDFNYAPSSPGTTAGGFNLTVTLEELDDLEGATSDTLGQSQITRVDAEGKPVAGWIKMDVDHNWFYDPTAYTHLEFNEPLNGYAATSGLGLGYDFYAVALHEMGHLLGISSGGDGLGGNLAINSHVTPVVGDVYHYEGWTIDATLYEKVHTHHDAHPDDLMNWQVPTNTRRLISPVVAGILRDAYDYTVISPPALSEVAAPITLSGGVLTINGDHGASIDDNVVISREGPNVKVQLNGVDWVFPPTAITGGIRVRTRAGWDSVTVDLSGGGVTPFGTVVNVDGGIGFDSLNVLHPVGALDCTLENNGVVVGGSKMIEYSHAEYLLVSSGSGADTVMVKSTPSSLVQLEISTQGGIDTIGIRGSASATHVGVYAGDGGDTINIGGQNNTLGNIGGPIIVAGGGNWDVVNVRDQNNNTGQLWTLQSDRLISPYLDLHFQTIEALMIKGGTGTDRFEVLGTPGSTFVEFNGGSSSDTLLGPNKANAFHITDYNGGSLNTTVFFVSVENLESQGFDDTFKFNPVSAALGGTIYGGSGSDKLDYTGHVFGVTVNLQTGQATETGGITSIESMVGGNGWDTLVGANTANYWYLTGSKSGYLWSPGGVTPIFNFAAVDNLTGGSALDALQGANVPNSWIISGANAGNRDGLWFFSSVEQITGGTNNDEFRFSDGASLSGNINGGGGSFDLVNYYPCYNPVTIDMNKLSNIDQVFGGGGSDTLLGAPGTNTWNVIGSNGGNVNGTAFAWVENLKGGPGADRFKLANASGVTGTIVGMGGIDTLDYSAYSIANPVVVNLVTSAATGTGGVNVENVTGGAGNDTLIGNNLDNILRGLGGLDLLQGGAGHDILVGGADNDTLEGGAGRDLLFGGLGADALSGGSEDDLLIGGSSFWESSDGQLTAMRDLWKAPDSNNLTAYLARINQLRNTFFFADYTVTDDNPGDVLTGEGGRDWFWANVNEIEDHSMADGELIK